jgi:hypothetical protein
MSPEQRRALTETALAERRTLVEVWTPPPSEPQSGPLAARWPERARLAAELLTDVESVLDVGCMSMVLEALLPPDVRYVPCDVVPRDDRTIVVDLNTEPPPEVDAQAVALLGVLEYIFDVEALMTTLAERHPIAVVSYAAHRGKPGTSGNRRNLFWVNDYSVEQVTELFSRTGWEVEVRRAIDQRQAIWRLASRRAAPARGAA